MVQEKLEGWLEEIDAVYKESNKIYVLGKSDINNFFRNPILHQVTHDANTGEILGEVSFRERDSTDISFYLFYFMPRQRERRRLTKEYKQDLNALVEEHLNNLKEAVKNIEVYPGVPDLGVPFERVDTGKPDKFIQAKDLFWLRVHAYELGANGIINYQPGSLIGTPVRFKK